MRALLPLMMMAVPGGARWARLAPMLPSSPVPRAVHPEAPLKAASAALARAKRDAHRCAREEAAASERLGASRSALDHLTTRWSAATEEARAAARCERRAAQAAEAADGALNAVPTELIFQSFLATEAVAEARAAHAAAAAAAAASREVQHTLEARVTVAAAELDSAKDAAEACAVELRAAIADRALWQHQVDVWSDANLAVRLEALQRHVETSRQDADAMRLEIRELRRLQAEQQLRSDWKRRENWPRLLVLRLGALVFSKVGGALLALWVLPQARGVLKAAWAAIVRARSMLLV
jgi:hypothetical protein